MCEQVPNKAGNDGGSVTVGLPRRRKRVLRPPPGPTESVYFIYSAGKMKIGYTNGSILDRISNLSVGSACPLTLVCLLAGTEQDERLLHYTFRSERLDGEWFKISDRMRRFLAHVDASYPQDDIRQYFPDWPTSIDRLEAAEAASRSVRGVG